MSDYVANTPTGPQNISNGQVTINNNFQQLDTIMAYDHYKWSDTTSAGIYRGFHKKCDFVEQASDPSTLENVMAIYSKAGATETEIFGRRESDGTVIQFTSGDPIVAANGESFLPGLDGSPLGIKWGTITVTSAEVTYSSLGLTDFANDTLAVTLGNINSSSTDKVLAKSATGITLTGNNGRIYYFIAIGY